METFEAPRLRAVHPGPVRLRAGEALIVLRSLELYPSGVAVTWTCSPSAGSLGRLAQAVPRVSLALVDADGAYPPLGEGTSGGGRTLFGMSFFGRAPRAGIDALEVTVTVTGATGAEVPVVVSAPFPLATAPLPTER